MHTHYFRVVARGDHLVTLYCFECHEQRLACPSCLGRLRYVYNDGVHELFCMKCQKSSVLLDEVVMAEGCESQLTLVRHP